jgi:hypothetical protein
MSTLFLRVALGECESFAVAAFSPSSDQSYRFLTDANFIKTPQLLRRNKFNAFKWQCQEENDHNSLD